MKTLFILATHGNEGFSIPVFKKLEKKYPKERYGYDWIIGNPKALAVNKRFVDVDLNRNAPGCDKSRNYEERRAVEIIKIAQNYDAVVDIHGAMSDCGICSIISLPTISNLILASQFGCQNNVIWNSKRSKPKGPLNQYIAKPAVELECGPKDSPKIKESLFKVISRYLNNRGRLVLGETDNWFSVIKKHNKKDFAKHELRDFMILKSEQEDIIPFLSQNTYSDGSFYQLQQVDFNSLFET